MIVVAPKSVHEENELSPEDSPLPEAEPEQAVETLSIEPLVGDESATDESMDPFNQTVEDEIEIEEPEPMKFDLYGEY